MCKNFTNTEDHDQKKKINYRIYIWLDVFFIFFFRFLYRFLLSLLCCLSLFLSSFFFGLLSSFRPSFLFTIGMNHTNISLKSLF